MKRFLPVAILLTVLCLLLCSCATTSEEAPKQFSLSRNEEKKNEIGMLVGSVSYGVGFFFPTAYDILDISLRCFGHHSLPVSCRSSYQAVSTWCSCSSL